MNRFIARAMVIDRTTAPIVAADVRTIGGAWAALFDAWYAAGDRVPYLVMMAHTKERLRKRAPLTAMAVTDDTLRMAMKRFCAELDGVRCEWGLCLVAGSAAEAIVREELMLDATTEGTA
jgi:hypothetical protein